MRRPFFFRCYSEKNSLTSRVYIWEKKRVFYDCVETRGLWLNVKSIFVVFCIAQIQKITFKKIDALFSSFCFFRSLEDVVQNIFRFDITVLWVRACAL